MSPQAQIRRMGWIVLLVLLTGLYAVLHLKVQAVHSDVVRAERRIVSLEQEKLLLTTEFETRANQLQLAAWNQVDFGYSAPTAGQFLKGQRQLASLGASALPAPSSSAEIQLANASMDGEAAVLLPAAELVQDDGPGGVVLAPARGEVRLARATLAGAADRVPLVALAGPATE